MKKICLFLVVVFVLPLSLFSQNIGIGTLTPTRAKLEIHGAITGTTAIIGGDGTGISLQRNLPAIGFNEYAGGGARYMANGYAAVQYLDQGSGYLNFKMFPSGIKDGVVSSSQQGLVIDGNGNIGIHTDPTTATLYVVKAGNTNGTAVFGGSENNCHFAYDVAEDTYIRGGKSTSKVVFNDIIGGKIILGGGITHVSINNGIPSYPLEIRQRAGTGMKMYQPSNNNNAWEQRMSLDPFYSPIDNLNMIYNGTYKFFFLGGNGTLYYYSDRRLKTNIRDIPSIMEKFMQLEPVEYNMKSFSNVQKKTAGFIAQDVQQLFPELVAVVKNTRTGYEGIDELLGLNYDGFRMLTIRAMQEQQQKIKEMQRENELLEKRIAAAEKLFYH